MRNFHQCHVNKLLFEHGGDRLAPALNAVSRDRKSTRVRQAATQGKGPGNEAGRPDVPKILTHFDPGKKSASVRQPGYDAVEG